MHHTITNRRALDSPGPREHFTNLQRIDWVRRKFFKPTESRDKTFSHACLDSQSQSGRIFNETKVLHEA